MMGGGMSGGGGGMGAGGWWQMIAQGVTDIANSALGQWQANKAAKKTRKFIKNMYKHRYQWAMDDLRAAGLNPILAADQTPPGPTSPGIGDVEAHGSSAVDTFIRAREAAASIQYQAYLSNKADSDAALANAQRTEILQRIPWVSDKLKAEIANLTANSAVNAARRQQIMEELPQTMFRSQLGGSVGPLLDSGLANSALGLLKRPHFEKTFNISR